MGTLTRREQWALIGVLGLILAGLGVVAWQRRAHVENRLVYVPGQGRWEKLADFEARPSPSPSPSPSPAPAPPAGAGNKAPAPSPVASQATPLPQEGEAAGAGGLDLNRATATELERLPGIGATRAQAILAARARLGGFNSLDQLDAVPGIGAKTLERLRPLVTLKSAAPAPAAPTLTPTPLPALAPRSTPALPQVMAAPAPRAFQPVTVVDINKATAEQLEVLPGIGKVLARRIVDDREAHGPYRNPRDLVRVQGIGPRNLAQMLPQIIAGPTK